VYKFEAARSNREEAKHGMSFPASARYITRERRDLRWNDEVRKRLRFGQA
jgi:hypothetical protein